MIEKFPKPMVGSKEIEKLEKFDMDSEIAKINKKYESEIKAFDSGRLDRASDEDLGERAMEMARESHGLSKIHGGELPRVLTDEQRGVLKDQLKEVEKRRNKIQNDSEE